MEASDKAEATAILFRSYTVLSAIVIDWELPNAVSISLLTQIRKNPATSHIPVLVLAKDHSSDFSAMTLGAHAVIDASHLSATLLLCLNNLVWLREGSALQNSLRKDKLTKLLNREAFLTEAAKLIASQEVGFYVLCAVDINKFNLINDQFGVERGDAVLKVFAHCLKQFVDSVSGLCCRMAADNFALLYPAAYMSSKKIEQNHKIASLCGGLVAPLTFSVGRYIVDQADLSVAVMYDRAALAKSTVKGRFDNHVAMYNESMRQDVLRTQGIVDDMEAALRDGQFEAWFQPQYDRSTGALVGAEALARWFHPKRGAIPPDVFVPIFEGNGFVYELDKWVWRQACAFLRKCADENGAVPPASVNVSRYDLLKDDVCEVLYSLMSEYGLPVELLRLEISETVFADRSARVLDAVKRLTELGFVVAIDNFGQDCSSLNALRDVPARALKLDMRFLTESGDLERGESIVESVVGMAHRLGMRVTAERVETQRQADELKRIGCDCAQGFLFGKPMSQADYAALVAKATREEQIVATCVSDARDPS